jgi:hypothetical protein
LVGLAQQVEGNFLKDVLTRNVNEVEFDRAVGAALRFDFLDKVFAALGHHVVVVESVTEVLVDNLGFAYCGLSRNHHS